MYLFFLFKKTYLNFKNTLLFGFSTQNNKADSYRYKWQRLSNLIAEYRIDIFIETGTYYGLTVSKIRKLVKRVVSIEIDPGLYRFNSRYFRNIANVEILEGDSFQVLQIVLDDLNIQPDQTCKVLFWLDGHCSEKETGIGFKYSPVEEELFVIKNHYNKFNSVIVIDDLRLMDGMKYPTLDQLVKIMPPEMYLCKTNGDAVVFIDNRLNLRESL